MIRQSWSNDLLSMFENLNIVYKIIMYNNESSDWMFVHMSSSSIVINLTFLFRSQEFDYSFHD